MSRISSESTRNFSGFRGLPGIQGEVGSSWKENATFGSQTPDSFTVLAGEGKRLTYLQSIRSSMIVFVDCTVETSGGLTGSNIQLVFFNANSNDLFRRTIYDLQSEDAQQFHLSLSYFIDSTDPVDILFYNNSNSQSITLTNITISWIEK